MKLEELQIGDWVMFKNKYTRIKRTSKSLIDTTDFYEILPSQIEPIPITPEILEKNGFVTETINGYSSYELDTRWGSILFYPGTEYYINIQTVGYQYKGLIKYVHELQHALRLCKIDKEIVL